ncbi:hypothetical protein SAMN04487970_10446 [Paenibacillus tianmuensis]|uniref:Uncharacterized protein n=1 Tax=Paenibacillus tianmuensis TaxID=624147 RepID=A0A1G4T8N3_9BACL|nr:hypothetical protein [Paenibacillus tianmuensis]SCW77165.1 hypothetical protein SAMN04487970_10446 [Paenibacillus tianmuensis]
MSIGLRKLLKDFQDIQMVWEAEKKSWEYENEKMNAMDTINNDKL